MVVTGSLGPTALAELDDALETVLSAAPAALLIELDVDDLSEAVIDLLASGVRRATKDACEVRIGVLRNDLKEQLDRDGRFPPVDLVEP